MTDCHELFSMVSLPNLVRLYHYMPEKVIEHRGSKTDFAYAYYWCMVVYFKQYLRTLYSPKLADKYSLFMASGKANTPFGIVVTTKRATTISFRGTAKPLDFLLILKGFIISKVKVPARLKGLLKHDDIEELRTTMHCGLLNRTLECLDMVYDQLPNDRKRPVYIHGHSMGAAIAITMAYFLRRLHFSNIHVTGLSCPKLFQPTSPIYTLKVRSTHYYTPDDPIVAIGDTYGFTLPYKTSIELKPSYIMPGKKGVLHNHRYFHVPCKYTRCLGVKNLLFTYFEDGEAIKLCNQQPNLSLSPHNI